MVVMALGSMTVDCRQPIPELLNYNLVLHLRWVVTKSLPISYFARVNDTMNARLTDLCAVDLKFEPYRFLARCAARPRSKK